MTSLKDLQLAELTVQQAEETKGGTFGLLFGLFGHGSYGSSSYGSSSYGSSYSSSSYGSSYGSSSYGCGCSCGSHH